MGDAATDRVIATGLEEAAGRPTMPELVPPDQWPDPHPHYHRMRTETPIKRFDEWDEFVFTRYADCERILRDPTMSSSPDHRRVRPDIPAFAEDFAARPASMLMMDPPDHTRLRKLVSKAFTPRAVETLRPHVVELVHGMLDQVDPSGFDVISSVGFPLPVTVICPVAMLRQRDQWDLLAADPSLAAGAVEECLRFDGPVHLTGRTATVDCEVGGQAVEKGQGCITLLAAANRDPERFPNPDTLDITRPDNHHLTFSHGIHYCRCGAGPARRPRGVQAAHPALPHPRARRGTESSRALRPARLPSRPRHRPLKSEVVAAHRAPSTMILG